MSKRNRYSSVSEMIEAQGGEGTFAEAFAERLASRQFIKALTVLRATAGMSQQELAEKLGCTQSKVAKLESSRDAELRFGDLRAYAGAVGREVRIFLVPQGQPLVDEVKMHAAAIKGLLDRLVRLADNGALSTGVADFLEEATLNLVRIAAKAAAALPALPEEPSLPVHVQALPDESDNQEPPGIEISPDAGRDPALVK